MKTRSQIMGLLANRKPATEEDKTAILSFCKKKRIYNIYFKGGSSSDDLDHELITFKEFVEWHATKHYIPGDVISDETGSVFLITHFVDGQSISKAHIDHQHKLSIDPVIVIKQGNSRKASFDEKLILQREMSKINLSWNPQKKLLTEKSIPESGRYVSMWTLEDHVGLGILKEVDSDGNLVLFCHINGPNTTVHGEGYIMGPFDDYTVKNALLSERSEIISKLTEINLRWAARRLRFEPINLRKKKGTAYFYITSSGHVKKTVESGRAVDDRRYQIGNYFHFFEEAERFLNHIILERNNRLSGNLELD